MRYRKEPEQLPLFDPPYRFAIDACSIFAQNPNSSIPRKVHASLWLRIDGLVANQEIVTCAQVRREVLDIGDLASQWVQSSGLVVIEEGEAIQRAVGEVVNKCPELLNFNKVKSSGDAFLIATAMVYGLAIITEEKKSSPYKIPRVAEQFGIKSYNLNEFCVLQGWEF